MRKPVRNVLITGTLALALGLAAVAAGPFRTPETLRELGLSPEQSRALADLRYAHRAKMIEERAALEAKSLELRRELDKEKPDGTLVLRLVDDVSALRARMARERMAHQLEVRKVLTPEQWTKAKDLFLRERGARRGRGRGGLRGGGPGSRSGFGPGSPGCLGLGGPLELPPEP